MLHKRAKEQKVTGNPLMDEIKETLAILKTRWLEVALIIGLGFLPNLLIRIFRNYPGFLNWVSLLVLFVSVLVTIISAGFLRTVYLEQDKRRSLPDLMLIGIHFFWRILGFTILCGSVVMLFVWLVRAITDTTFPFATRISLTFITLILAKLTLLIPAIIIILDCSLSKSFGFMWKIKLLKAKPLLMIFLIKVVILPYLLLFFPNFHCPLSVITWSYTLSALHSIMLRFLTLMVQVMAVRFVGSLGIDCNAPYKPPEPFKSNSFEDD